MEKISTDFFKYGTFGQVQAEILKDELEKRGIPVKALYPGTNVGKESSANAEFYAFTLMIRACDFTSAEEIRKSLAIESIGKGDIMPYVSKSFKGWYRLILAEIALFLIAIFVLGRFEEELSQKEITHVEGITQYTTDAYSVGLGYIYAVFFGILLITIFVYLFKTMRKWFEGKSLDEK